MIKRISATLLIIAMLAVVSAISPVMAIATTLTDDFENAADNIFNASSATNYYYASSNGLLLRPTMDCWSNNLSLAATEGYNGTTGLRMKSNTRYTSNNRYRQTAIMTKAITLTDTSAAVLRYKIYIEKIGAVSQGSWMIALSAVTDPQSSFKTPDYYAKSFNIKDTFNFVDSTSTYISANTWYSVVSKLTGADATKTLEIYILDENGKVCFSKSKSIDGLTANNPVNLWPVYIKDNSEKETSLIVDDVSLTEYSVTDKVSIDAKNTNVSNAETEVAINKNFNLAFDQAITAPTANAVKLYKTNDALKSAVDITLENITFNSFTVNPVKDLDINTSYTLDFSGITNNQGVAIDNTKTITFTTVDPNKVPVKLESAKTSSGRAFADGLTGVTLDESFVLNFNSAIITPVANTDIKMYLNNADKTAVNVSVKLTNDKKSVTVTPEDTLSLATEYVIDFSAVLSDSYGAIEGISSLSFTTQARREMLYYEDDIEAANTGTLSNYESDVFSVASSPVLSAEEKAGYNNSKGICINSVKKGEGITTKAYPLDASERVVFEYKINISFVSSDAGALKNVGIVYVNGVDYNNTLLEIKTDEYGYARIGKYSTSYPYYFRMNTWYTIICDISKSAQNIYMFDEKGKLVYDCNYLGAAGKTIGDTVSIYPIFGTRNGTINAVIDDVKIYRLSDHELDLQETKSDITEDGMTNLIANDNITLVFNQPVNASRQEIADAFELFEDGTKISASAKKLDANKICIIPERMLKDATHYTVKLPAIKALLGNSSENVKEIDFTTKDLYSVKATQTSLNVSGGSIDAGEYTLTLQNSGAAIADGVIVAAVYNAQRPAKLIKLKIFENISVPQGTSTKTLSFDEAVLGADSVELFLYSTLTSPKSLMRSYKVFR